MMRNKNYVGLWVDVVERISRQKQSELVGAILEHDIPVASKIELFAEWFPEDIYQHQYPPSAKDNFDDWLNGTGDYTGSRRQNRPFKRVEKTGLVAHYGGEVERAIKINPELRYELLETDLGRADRHGESPRFLKRSVPEHLEDESGDYSRAEFDTLSEIEDGFKTAARQMQQYVGLARETDSLPEVDTGSSNSGDSADEERSPEPADPPEEDLDVEEINERIRERKEIHAKGANRGDKIPDFGLEVLMYGRLAVYFETVTNPDVSYHVLNFGDESIRILGTLEADELEFKSAEDLDPSNSSSDIKMSTKERIKTAGRETLSIFLADSFYQPDKTDGLTDVTRAFEPSNVDQFDEEEFDPSSLRVVAETDNDDLEYDDMASIARWNALSEADITVTPQQEEKRIEFHLEIDLPYYLQ